MRVGGAGQDQLHREQADRPRPSITTRNPCVRKEDRYTGQRCEVHQCIPSGAHPSFTHHPHRSLPLLYHNHETSPFGLSHHILPNTRIADMFLCSQVVVALTRSRGMDSMVVARMDGCPSWLGLFAMQCQCYDGPWTDAGQHVVACTLRRRITLR